MESYMEKHIKYHYTMLGQKVVEKGKKIIENTKQYKLLYLFLRSILIIYYNYIICYMNEFLKHMRILGLLRNQKFSEIRKYKNKHAGQRCFIVCTGPSMKYEDLELLKGEITFSMNGIVKGFHKTDWRPTYYGIQDQGAYEEYQELLLKDETLTLFIADWIVKRGYNIPVNSILFPHSRYKHCIFPSEVKLSTKFSSDVSALVYDGYTITYSELQIAVYMGFKEIYLLGCDCYYSPDPEKWHFVERYSRTTTQHVDPTATMAASRMLYAYQVAKRYADKHHIRIYNATRGGHLNVFERVSLEDVLS
jgi:hypothetical protein